MVSSIYTEQYKKVAKKLENARIVIGYTQQEVAEKIKKSQSYVSKVETGQQRIDIVELKELAGIYKKKINYFVE